MVVSNENEIERLIHYIRSIRIVPSKRSATIKDHLRMRMKNSTLCHFYIRKITNENLLFVSIITIIKHLEHEKENEKIYKKSMKKNGCTNSNVVFFFYEFLKVYKNMLNISEYTDSDN